MPEPVESYEDTDLPLLLYSGLHDAFIGSVETYGKPPVACYSKRMTINILQKEYGLSEKESYRRYEYEYLQSDYGEATPVFLDDEPLKDVS